MNRRGFLKMIGGVVAATAVPIAVMAKELSSYDDSIAIEMPSGTYLVKGELIHPIKIDTGEPTEYFITTQEWVDLDLSRRGHFRVYTQIGTPVDVRLSVTA